MYVHAKSGGQRERKLLQKPITSELGTVAPWVIGPGEWTDEQVLHHALYFVACLMHNNSCNCMSPQVLILPQHGFPRAKFMSQVYGNPIDYMLCIFVFLYETDCSIILLI